MTTTGNPIEAVRARLDGGKRWIKGSLHTPEGSCLLGAITVACKPSMSTENDREFHRVAWAVTRVIREQYPDRKPEDYVDGGISTFNDHEDTDWPDVDLFLDKASIAWDEAIR